MKGYTSRLIKDAERLERQAYQNFTHIFSISEYLKENLINHYGVDPGKITVVGTGRGILQPYFEEKTYDSNRILFAAKGRFLDKGGDLVLKAFRKARETNPKLRLTIVGQNDYSDRISEPHVETHGFVSVEQLQEIFNTHDLFLMPALNEPWGLVFIEALACKMPIMGLNRNSFPEISGYGKYGYLVKSQNTDELARILVESMANPEELARKGAAGQAYCLEKFTWNNVADTLVKTIRNNYTT
jgi:glycosyltransferase involved in cell wall biosynthesis